MKNKTILELIGYIKTSINILVSIKIEEKIKELKNQLFEFSQNQNSPWEYEALLIKEEAAIRDHISYEHQLKIEYDKLNEKIWEIEYEKNKIIEENVM